MKNKLLFRQVLCIFLFCISGCDQDTSTFEQENEYVKAINETLKVDNLKAEKTIAILTLKNKLHMISASGELITNVRDVNDLIEIQLEYGDLLSISKTLINHFEINEDNWIIEFTFADSTTTSLPYLGAADVIEVLVKENPYQSSTLSVNITIKSPIDVRLNLKIEYSDYKSEHNEDIYIETDINDTHILEISNLRENYLNVLKISGLSELGNERFMITKSIQTGSLPNFSVPLIERVYTNIARDESFEQPVVFTGDSMIHRMNWNYIFRKISNISDFPIIFNRGIGGNRSVDLLRRFNDNVLKLNPSAVFIEIGTNDFVRMTSSDSKNREDKLIDNYKKILELGLNSSDNINIYIISIIPVLGDAYRNNSAQRINDALEEYSLESARLHFINSFELFFDASTNEVKHEYMLGPHTAHLNDLGYHVWAKQLFPYILNIQ